MEAAPETPPIPPPQGKTGDWRAILCLVVFLITNVIVVFPFKIPIPIPNFSKYNDQHDEHQRKPRRTLHLPLNFATAPFLGVLFLLATTSIGGDTVRKGILGADGIKPIDIMALFISLAYIAISLDATGLLRFLAFWMVSRSSSESGGRKLYLYLYLLFLAFGVVVGNDPVILSGTAFLAYMTRVAGIVPPTAWIFAQFSVANIASTVLVSSNPTNLVLTGAFSISFTTYTLNVVLPALASAILLFPFLLYVVFPSPTLIPRSVYAAGLGDPSAALVDKPGAIFGSGLLIATLAVLLGVSAAGVHVEVWSITVPAAIIMLVRDMWHDVSSARQLRNQKKEENGHNETNRISDEHDITPDIFNQPVLTRNNTPEPFHQISPEGLSPAIALRRLSSITSGVPTQQTLPSVSRNSTNTSLIPKPTIFSRARSRLFRWSTTLFAIPGQIASKFPTATTVSKRLPFALLPFAFSMFILVQGLGHAWLNVFAGWWFAWVKRTGTVGSVLGSYIITVVACNFCGTNIGATILLARIFQLWIQTHSPSARTAKGAIYALALGSNYGAFSASFSASLAGLLWKTILEQKGIRVGRLQFATINLGLNAVAMVGGCAVLVGQLYVKG